MPPSLFSLPTTAQRASEPGVYSDGLTLYGNVLIRRFVLRKGEVVPGHAHRFDHLSLLLRGRMRVTVDGHEKTYSAPQEVVMAKGLTHRLEALDDNTIWLCIFACRDADGSAVENIVNAQMDPTI